MSVCALTKGDSAAEGLHAPKEEATGVKSDNDIDLGNAGLRQGDGVDVVHEVGEKHLKVRRRAEEGEEVDEGDSGDGLETGRS